MPNRKFRYWVVLGGMRTGSNLLEEHLAAFPEISAYGELFNPHFFGRPNQMAQFGLSLSARESDPQRVIEAMQETNDGLPGFRLFYDHDPRVIDHVLNDPLAAKIVLSRRPIESYVSLKVARKTGQWWLGDLTTARAAKVQFDGREFAEFLDSLSAFQSKVSRGLQVTGQAAFHIDYDDLSDADVIAGLGQFLGLTVPQELGRVRAKVQNPGPLADRLTNPGEAEDLLNRLSTPDIGQAPQREPERGPGLKFFRACETTALVYMPIRGAGQDPVPDWLASVDPEGALLSGLTQHDLRRWKRQHPGHRGFTVVRHPLPRAYDAFCRYLLTPEHESYADLRAALIARYDVPLPMQGPDAAWTLAAHQGAFLAFLVFLKGNLGGQTSLRVDNSWASQATLLHAIAEFAVPDRVIREDTLGPGLCDLAREVGVEALQSPPHGFATDLPFALADVQNDAIDAAIRAAYQRDFMMFGFDRWTPSQAA